MDCPVCRAGNDEGPLCRRCKADLSMLFDLERLRRQRLTEAREALKCEDLHRAEALLTDAEKLRSDDELRQARAVLALLCGDFEAAVRLYHNLA
jgi:hypothetical protein